MPLLVFKCKMQNAKLRRIFVRKDKNLLLFFNCINSKVLLDKCGLL